jgi:hypothetical protein
VVVVDIFKLIFLPTAVALRGYDWRCFNEKVFMESGC